MSYEKINDLIEQAPEVSQWWVSNKRALNRSTLSVQMVRITVVLLSIFSVLATIAVYATLADGSLRPGVRWALLAAPLVAVCGLRFGFFLERFTPQRFRRKGLVLRGFVKEQTMSLTGVHDILSQAIKISDPQMKPILARLHALKDTDLPQCWWDALDCEVSKCVVAQHPPVTRSAQEKLDAVLVQMEDVSTTPSIPKVLRL